MGSRWCVQVGLSLSGEVARTTNAAAPGRGEHHLREECWVGIEVVRAGWFIVFGRGRPNYQCGRPRPWGTSFARGMLGWDRGGARRLVYRFRARSPELPMRPSPAVGNIICARNVGLGSRWCAQVGLSFSGEVARTTNAAAPAVGNIICARNVGLGSGGKWKVGRGKVRGVIVFILQSHSGRGRPG